MTRFSVQQGPGYGACLTCTSEDKSRRYVLLGAVDAAGRDAILCEACASDIAEPFGFLDETKVERREAKLQRLLDAANERAEHNAAQALAGETNLGNLTLAELFHTLAENAKKGARR